MDFGRLTRSPIPLTILFLLVAGTTIATAWGFQLIGGYVPCALCLEQRDPYYIALPLALLALVGLLLRWPKALCGGLLLIAGCAMVYGAGLGVYQSGAEWDFWPGPTDCAGGSTEGLADATNLLSQLKSTRIVSCTEASWRFLGLSFAGWNAAASAFVSLLAFAAAISSFKRK